MCRPSFHPLFRLTCVAMSYLLVSQLAIAEAWTDLNATRTIEARMLGLWGDSVVLQMQDGKKVTVLLDDLNAESRIQARKLSGNKITSRKSLVDELKGQATEAAAPAPTPLPTPRAAPAYVPPTPGGTAVAQLQWLVDQLQAGHMRAYFDVLPMTYRGDAEKLVKQGVDKVDPTALKSLAGSLQQVGDLIVTRQRWLFSHPRLQALQPSAQDLIRSVLLNMGGLLRVGLDSQAIDPANLKAMPLQEWIAQRSDAMAPYLYEMSTLPGASSSRPILELVSEKDGVATIKMTSGEKPVQFDFVDVDGFWVNKSLADDWAKNVETANQQLAAMPDGSLLSAGEATMVTAVLGPQLEQILAVKNEKDFHAAMEPMFAMLAPMLSQVPGLMKKQGGSGYDDGYGEMDMSSDMDMDYEEEMRMEESMSDGSMSGDSMSGRERQ